MDAYLLLKSKNLRLNVSSPPVPAAQSGAWVLKADLRPEELISTWNNSRRAASATSSSLDCFDCVMEGKRYTHKKKKKGKKNSRF